MYKDLQEENRKLEREIGRLEEQLKHLKDLIKKEENKSLITNFDSHAETVQKSRAHRVYQALLRNPMSWP